MLYHDSNGDNENVFDIYCVYSNILSIDKGGGLADLRFGVSLT